MQRLVAIAVALRLCVRRDRRRAEGRWGSDAPQCPRARPAAAVAPSL